MPLKLKSIPFDFVNSQGEKLSGRLELPQSQPRAFAIFAHCFTCSKSIIAAAQIPRSLTAAGIAVLRFDFTGLGRSEGDFADTNFSSNVDDLVCAYEALAKEYEAPKILIGHSLGGAAVLKVATQLPEVKAVVTLGAPSDVKHVAHNFEESIKEIKEHGEAKVSLAGRDFKIKKQFLDDIEQATVLDGVANFRKALLVMHSPTDNTVSVDHASQIFLAAKHPKSFVSLDTADHLLMKTTDAQYVAKIISAWVDRFIPQLDESANAAEAETVLVKTREGHKFTQDVYTSTNHGIADEPKSFGGDDLGFSPYEHLLAGLGACTSMTVKMYAERKQWPLEGAEVILKHDKIHAKDCEQCETETGKVDRITKEIHLKGSLDAEQRQKLHEIAEKCPVNRTLKSEIFIESLGGE